MCKSYESITEVGPENVQRGENKASRIQLQEDKNKNNNIMVTATAKILESINAYGSIVNLKNAARDLELQKDKLEKKNNLLRIENKQIEDKKIEIGTPLKDYEHLSKTVIGFGNGTEFFSKLKVFCNSHGIYNTTELLEVINTYGNLLEIKKKSKS